MTELLRQPHGFEGFLARGVLRRLGDLTVTDLDHNREVLGRHWDAAPLRPTRVAHVYDHPFLAGIDQLEQFRQPQNLASPSRACG